MKKKNIYIALAVVLLGAVIGGIVAYKMYNMPHKDFAASKPDFEVTAQAIFDEFTADENASTQKYVSGDKTVQISGVVVSFTQENDSTATLAVADKQGGAAIANCNIMPEFFAQASALQAGQAVKVKGQCTGFQGLIDPAVFFERCAVVE